MNIPEEAQLAKKWSNVTEVAILEQERVRCLEACADHVREWEKHFGTDWQLCRTAIQCAITAASQARLFDREISSLFLSKSDMGDFPYIPKDLTPAAADPFPAEPIPTDGINPPHCKVCGAPTGGESRCHECVAAGGTMVSCGDCDPCCGGRPDQCAVGYNLPPADGVPSYKRTTPEPIESFNGLPKPEASSPDGLCATGRQEEFGSGPVMEPQKDNVPAPGCQPRPTPDSISPVSVLNEQGNGTEPRDRSEQAREGTKANGETPEATLAAGENPIAEAFEYHRVCAWCGASMGGGTSSLKITHGICQPCSVKLTNPICCV